MDKKRSVLNITISIISKVILLVFAIVLRSFLIKYAGNEANGVFSLYTSIIGFLAVAELGVGTAISFSMYKPIVDGDNKKVSALYNLYKKVYFIIGAIIVMVGICLLPTLPILAKDYSSSFSLYWTFLIMLADVALTYIYSCKTSLINAYKNNYITTLINAITIVIRSVIQILVLIWTSSFELYLIARVFTTLLEWLITEIYTRKKYKDIISTKEKIDSDTKMEVLKNTKAMFMHKIGGLLVNTMDNFIISAFIGVVILGLYSNYIIIIASLQTLLSLVFNSLTSVIGHLCAEGDVSEEKKYFKFLYFLNFAIGTIFFIGYYAVVDDIVALCFGADLVMDYSISLVITINYFIQYLRLTVLVYRDATGTFYNDRWKPVFEGIVNIVLSIAFVHWCGVVGVIIATIITNIFICHIVEPHVLYKYGFKQKATKYYILNFVLIGVFCLTLFCFHLLKQSFENLWVDLIVNGFLAVGIALIPLILLFIISKTFRENTIKVCEKILFIFKKNKFKNDVKVESQEDITNEGRDNDKH